MSTRILNITGGPVSLPAPYRGLLPPGRGTILSDDPATVIANVGLDSVNHIFDLGPTNEPGKAANDPLKANPLPTYTNITRPLASAVGGAPNKLVEIGNSDDSAPNLSDGINWYDAAGNLT